MELSKIEELGVEPVAVDRPAGGDSRESGSFEKLKDELIKLDSLTGGVVDWKTVITLAVEILSKESKDLLVASYLCVGLLVVNGFKGLKAGLTCYKGLLTNFWEGMFPPLKRMKGRVGAVEWLAERTTKIAATVQPNSDDRQALKDCKELIQELNVLLRELFKDDGPLSLSELARTLDSQLSKLPPEAPKPVETKKTEPIEDKKSEPKQPSAAKTVFAQPSAPTDLESIDDAIKQMHSLNDSYLRVSQYIFDKDSSNALSYRIVRFLSWLEIDELPSNDNMVTMITSPQDYLVTRANDFLESGNWQALLGMAEDNIINFPFWLDLNYYSALSLTRLGKSYKGAQQAVCDELSKYLNRFPEITNLLFSDGRPFADKETIRWIETSVLNGDGATAGTINSGSGGESKINELKNSANSLMSERKYKEAISLFHEQLNSVSNLREKFICKLEIAKTCLNAGEPTVATAILTELNNHIEQFSIDLWEPALAAETLHFLWLSLNLISDMSAESQSDMHTDTEQRLRLTYERLCRLDPILAFELNNNNNNRR
ncbi:MAG: type VI secretion system protein TssA [Nitrospirae bacterium]|nr:type VI secretion system protein TssA [Nitrospirota bacterium]